MNKTSKAAAAVTAALNEESAAAKQAFTATELPLYNAHNWHARGRADAAYAAACATTAAALRRADAVAKAADLQEAIAWVATPTVQLALRALPAQTAQAVAWTAALAAAGAGVYCPDATVTLYKDGNIYVSLNEGGWARITPTEVGGTTVSGHDWSVSPEGRVTLVSRYRDFRISEFIRGAAKALTKKGVQYDAPRGGDAPSSVWDEEAGEPMWAPTSRGRISHPRPRGRVPRERVAV